MRRRFLAAVVLVPTLAGCASFSQGLSMMAEGMGGRCVRVHTDVGPWNPSTGKYDMGKFKTRDANGNDIEASEDRWLQSRAAYFADQALGNYYDTSPYSGYQYRFATACSEWANQQ